MTRRELILAAAAPLADAARSLDGAPWMRVTIACSETGHYETTLYSVVDQYRIAEMAQGDTFTVESSEHDPIRYVHKGPPGEAIYFPVHRAIFGPAIERIA